MTQNIRFGYVFLPHEDQKSNEAGLTVITRWDKAESNVSRGTNGVVCQPGGAGKDERVRTQKRPYLRHRGTGSDQET